MANEVEINGEDITLGVWKTKSKDGVDYMAGVHIINGFKYRVCCFKNKMKEKDTHPDWNVVFFAQQDQQEYQQQQQQYGQNRPSQRGTGPATQEVDEDDLPF